MNRFPQRMDRWFMAALVVCPFLWYFVPVFTSRCLFYDDLAAQYYPWWEYARQRILAGGFPLWNPFVLGGMPYHTNPETFLFYPLKWPLLWMPFAVGSSLLRVLNTIVASLGMFVFLRRLGLRRQGAAAGSLFYAYGSFMAYQFVHIPYVNTVAWVPWELMLARQLIRWPKAENVFALAAVVSLSFLGGSPGMFLIAQVGVAAYAGCLLAGQAGAGAWRRVGRAVVWGSAAALLTVALTAVLLFPVLEFVEHSVRAGGLEDSFSMDHYVLSGDGLRLLLFPWLHYVYGAPYPPMHTVGLVAVPTVGVAGTALALAMLFSRRGRRLFPCLLLIGGFGCLMAAGTQGGMFRTLTNSCVVLRWFRWPVDYLFLTYLALAISAAVGVDVLARRWTSRRWFAPAAGLLLALLAADLFFYSSGYRLYTAASEMAYRPWEKVVARAAAHACEGRVSVGSSGWQTYFRGEERYGGGFMPLFDPIPKALDRPLFDDWLRSVSVGARTPAIWKSRILFEDQDRWSRHYPVNWGMVLGVQELSGYDPFMLDRTATLFAAIPVERTWEWFDVRAVVRAAPMPGLERIHEENGLRACRTERTCPRVHLVGNVERYGSPAAVLGRLKESEFDCRKTVLLEGEAAGVPAYVGEAGGTARLVGYRPERVRVEVAAEGPAVLVLHDVYYPGWRARIDGVDVPVWRANFAFRAVPVPAGRHVVDFEFRPRRFHGSAAVSGLAWAGMLACWGWARGRRRKGVR